MTDRSRAEEFHEPKAITIHDVARKAGVSIATVSRVLNGVSTVDPALAERVHAAAIHLKYQPSRAARILAGRSSVLVGLLVTDMQNPFFLDLIRGVEEVLQQQGYLLIVCNTLEDAHKEAQYLEVLAAEPVAGVIIVPTQGRIAVLGDLKDRNIPVVAVDRQFDDRSTDCVLIDNAAAAREAVAHLIANGYRRIGMIGGPKSVTNANERVLGYRQALQEAGIPREAVLEQRGSMIAPDAGIHLTNKLLDLDPPVDAIFTANNRLTMGALRAIHARQKHIPADIGLVGFDELYWSVPELVSITTVIQSAYDIGSTAASRLLQRLQKPDAPRQEIILQHQLVVRDSSRPRVHTSDRSSQSPTRQARVSRKKDARGEQLQKASSEC
ncbi:LacI family DNA-binding transcriptional regulator [Dictyobacter aurantiacus]|uniref:LacI family transcriptional regulator n=1 Tax=Dictyobacter aurantiacus TaxID=1936993 RepID=A0A401ZS25_9CHLR|nr:LacI family DNA-binding transcriptional regulator [Dictyobacter aurantiacus]GCE09580.1 LacI family transcriptional regulator [Dictyobacter aurantiacus]